MTDLQPSDSAWYCLRTQRKREHIAAAALLAQIGGIEVFCPRISQVKRTRTGKKRFLEAMFPSYLFARFIYEQQFRQVIHTQGVVGIVENGEQRVIPAPIIAELRVSVPGDLIELEDPSIEPGAKVQILKGGLKGLNGEVLAHLPAKNRVEVLLEFLGRELRVTVESDEVHLAED